MIRARVEAMLTRGIVVVLLAAGCASAPTAPVSAPRPAPIVWTTTLDRTHPLVGKIWSTKANAFVDEPAVVAALHGHVLLGEKHDNPDHHALQARMLRAMVEKGEKPIVAFEMFDTEDQETIDQARASRDPEALAAAVKWKDSGWPPWDNYSPIAKIALDSDLRLVATGLPPRLMRAMMHPAPDAKPLDEGAPLTDAQHDSLAEELKESHCGHLPDSMLAPMIRFQRARDASMANALLAAANAAHATDTVLIAGTGHTRTDRGAGHDLKVRDPSRSVTSVAFAEVEAGKPAPADYAARWNATALPFDFVWFTPRATDEDPCAAFEKPKP